MKDLSYRFLVSWWIVHNQFINLGKLSDTIVYHLLIRGIIYLGHQDEFPIVNVPTWMVIY